MEKTIPYLILLKEQMNLAKAAGQAFESSVKRSEQVLIAFNQNPSVQLSDGQRETLVALTSRYARFTDLLFQRLFRTLDQLELIDEGSHIDRLNRMEKRGIFTSANLWQNLRQLRNDIVHEYLIEASDYVVTESLKVSQEVLETLKRLENYIQAKGY